MCGLPEIGLSCQVESDGVYQLYRHLRLGVIVANLPDIRLRARMLAILSAKLADSDAFSGSDLVIFRPFLSLCDSQPDRKP
jgi:hypothetical protein